MSHGYSDNDKMPAQCRSYVASPGAAFNLAPPIPEEGAPPPPVLPDSLVSGSIVDPWTMRAPLAPLFSVDSLLWICASKIEFWATNMNFEMEWKIESQRVYSRTSDYFHFAFGEWWRNEMNWEMTNSSLFFFHEMASDHYSSLLFILSEICL